MNIQTRLRNGLERVITSEQELEENIENDVLGRIRRFSQRVWGEEAHRTETFMDLEEAIKKNTSHLSSLYVAQAFPKYSIEETRWKIIGYAKTRILSEGYKISKELYGDEAEYVNVDGQMVDIKIMETLYS